ncbi:MAG: hypothetical protein LBI18_06605 [Planctomycetaceae bacterium]|nr:hypothetical protein [Planctomycetaceae bacterium]
MPKLYPVQLTLVQEGKPLDGAMVLLKRHSETTKYSCGGLSGANGVVKIQTHGKYAGAPEGSYTVTVSKTVTERSGPWNEIPSDEAAAQTWLQENRSRLKETNYHIIDPKYGDSQTSDLKIDVTTKGLKTTLDLGNPVRLEMKEDH